eukprot:10808362-Prorocentrum_lima.AAC.1
MTSSLVGSEMCIRDRALVLSNDQQVMQKLHMDYILVFLASFTDLRKAKTCLLYTSDAADDM